MGGICSLKLITGTRNETGRIWASEEMITTAKTTNKMTMTAISCKSQSIGPGGEAN